MVISRASSPRLTKLVGKEIWLVNYLCLITCCVCLDSMSIVVAFLRRVLYGSSFFRDLVLLCQLGLHRPNKVSTHIYLFNLCLLSIFLHFNRKISPLEYNATIRLKLAALFVQPIDQFIDGSALKENGCLDINSQFCTNLARKRERHQRVHAQFSKRGLA